MASPAQGPRYQIFTDRCYGTGTTSFATPAVDGETGSPRVAKVSRFNYEQPFAFERLVSEAAYYERVAKAAHVVKMRAHFCLPDFYPAFNRYVLILDLLRSSNRPDLPPQNAHELLTQFEIKAFTSDQIVSCAAQLVECLQDFKKQGVLNCDIKSQNLIINRDSGQLKVIDLGTAIEIEKLINNNDLTTCFVRPPEMFLERKATDFGVDMWSLGVTLFELYTGGSLPFPYGVEDDYPLRYILNTLGLPSDEYIETCNTTRQCLEEYVDKNYVRDWKAMIRTAAEIRGDSKARVEHLIDFLERIFCYEKRMTVEEAAEHLYLKTDTHIHLDLKEVSKSERKTLGVLIQGWTIPLDHCIHFPRSDNNKYDVSVIDLMTKESLVTSNMDLPPGYTLELAEKKPAAQ